MNNAYPTVRYIALAFLIATASIGTAHAAEEPTIIKFSHVVANDTPKGKAVQRFKDVAERRTGGRIRVDIYPNSSLYRDKDEIEALLTGKVEMLAPSLAKLEQIGVTEFEVFNVPFLFPGKDLLRRVTDGAIGQELLKKLEPHGVVGLAYWDNGFRGFISNKPIRRPSDLMGLRMRISSKSGEPLMRIFRAIPVETPFAQVYEALRTGSVDGTENTASNFYTQKMHEVQRHLTVSNHSYLGYGVVVNKRFWDSLPADIRVQLKLAMNDATRYANLLAESENDAALTKIKAYGGVEVYALSIDERSTWRKASLPVHGQFEARVGKELIRTIYSEGTALGYRF